MLDWIQQTLAGARSVDVALLERPRFGHPVLSESLSARAARRTHRGRKRLEAGPRSVDDLYAAARAAGGAGALDAQDQENAAIAF